MSLNSQEKEYTDKILKAPKPPKLKPSRKISFINIIEAEDDSDSESNMNNINVYIENKLKVSDKKVFNIFNDDRYEDSYDEEFGECETNPNSGKLNILK